MASVTFKALRKVFPNGHVGVDNADFTIADGELLVLVGPSGCGKSTLLRLIAGLEEATSGAIYIGDREITRLAPRDRDIAMVFQSYALYPHMTVEDNLGFGLKLRGYEAADIAKRVGEAAQTLELNALLQRLPKQLSGGQRQRVALGRALVRQPQVFLLDEPLSNLDAKLRGSMRAEIARLHRSLQTTMVYVTHDQVEAMTLGQRIVVMDRGIIQQIDAPMRIYDRPRNLFVAGFLGNPTMNLLHGRARIASDMVLEGQGASLTLPMHLPSGTSERIRDKEVVLGVRPEDLQRASAQPSSRRARLQADVELVESIGNEAFIHARTGGWQLVARSAPYELPEIGARVTLEIDLQRVHLFDATSGDRIELST